MNQRRIDRVPPRGRRATILRAALDRPTPLADIARRVSAIERLKVIDPAIDRLKTTAAVKALRRQGFLTKTPYGWRATPAGEALLRASEERHG